MSHSSTRDTSRLVADAAIRVISRDGLDQASVRTVAAEARLAAGTVQHHFPTRDALLVGAFNRVLQRQLQRIMSPDQQTLSAKDLRRSIIELMPFDEARREEAIVWLVFSAAAPSRPSLIAPHTAGISLTRDLIRNALAYARDHDELRADLDLTTESVLLAATIDGLLMHAVSAEAESWPLIEEAIDAALRHLFIASGNRGHG